MKARSYNCYYSNTEDCGAASDDGLDPLWVLPIVAIVTTAAAFSFGYCFFVVPFLFVEDECLDQKGVLVDAVVRDYTKHDHGAAYTVYVLGVEYEYKADKEVLWIYKKVRVSKQRYEAAVKMKQIRIAVLPPDQRGAPRQAKQRYLAVFCFGIILVITMTLALFSIVANPSFLAVLLLFVAVVCPAIAFCIARWLVQRRNRAYVGRGWSRGGEIVKRRPVDSNGDKLLETAIVCTDSVSGSLI